MLLILWVFSPQVRRSKVEGPWQQRYIHLQIWSSTSGREEVHQAHMGSVFLSIKTSFKGEQQNLYINSKADREHHDVVSENQDCSHVMSPLCCCSWFWVSKRTKRTFLHDLTELCVAVHVKSHRMVLVSHLKPKGKCSTRLLQDTWGVTPIQHQQSRTTAAAPPLSWTPQTLSRHL